MTRKQALKRLGWAWCILCSATSTVFGIIGALERDNDRT
jgi:hypothetical protein